MNFLKSIGATAKIMKEVNGKEEKAAYGVKVEIINEKNALGNPERRKSINEKRDILNQEIEEISMINLGMKRIL